MSDLISRKSVLDKLKDFSNMYTLEEEARIVLETIVRMVTEQPTTYDISKVVAELDNAESVKVFGSLNSGNRLIPVSDAIDIVRKGGVE